MLKCGTSICSVNIIQTFVEYSLNNMKKKIVTSSKTSAILTFSVYLFVFCFSLKFIFVFAGNDLFDVKYILEEHESTHFSIKALLVLSRLNCARMCTLNNDCYGFEYDVIDHTCQMISAISTIAFGKVHYYVKQF